MFGTQNLFGNQNNTQVQQQNAFGQLITVNLQRVPELSTLSGTNVGKLNENEIRYPNFDTYEGGLVDNLREGFGTYKWANGGNYVGNFQANIFYGQGKLTLENGDVFEGNWEDGYLNGETEVTWADNANLKSYKGDFIRNNADGKGLLTFVQGDTYKGYFSSGVYNGKGTMRYTNGDVFDGRYSMGYPNQEGTFMYKEANLFQERKFNNGVDRVTSQDLKAATYNLKDQRAGEKAIPVSMCKAVMRKNPNTDLGQELLGKSVNKKTKRVKKTEKTEKTGKAKKTKKTEKTDSKTKISQKVKAKKRAPKQKREQWVFKPAPKMNRWEGSKSRTTKADLNMDIENNENQGNIKRTKSIECTMKAAKKFLKRNNNMNEE